MSIQRILVVDDDALSREFLVEAIHALGYQPVEAKNAAEALEFVRKSAPDLVLTDLRMPGADGIAVLQQLSALTTSPFSGIVISGDTRPETIHAVGAAGFALLHKPVAAAKLRALVMQFDAMVRESKRPNNDHENPAR